MAPFWHDVDIRANGSVYYQVFHSTDESVDLLFDTVNGFIQYKTNTSFEGTWMLVAAWDAVPVYPYYYALRYERYFSSSFKERILKQVKWPLSSYHITTSFTSPLFLQRNSFEAIIISGGAHTYAVYTYNCQDLQNPGAFGHAVIGYNLNGLQSKNNPFSGSRSVQNVACGNFPASNWFNLVYQLSTVENEVLNARQECTALIEQDKEDYSSYNFKILAAEESPCPCTLHNAWRDRNYRWDPDDFFCYYRRFPNSSDQFGQYCCYDFNF